MFFAESNVGHLLRVAVVIVEFPGNDSNICFTKDVLKNLKRWLVVFVLG